MPLPTLAAYVAGSGKTLLVSFDTNLLSYVVSVSQSLMIKGTPGLAGTGRWTATFSGQTTTGLEPGCRAATLQAALEALSTIGTGNITVAGEYPYQATFAGTMEGIPQPLFTTNTSGLAATSIAAPLTAGSGSNVILDSTIGANFSRLGSSWVDGVSGFGPSYKTLATGTGLNQGEWKVTGLATGNYNIYMAPIGTLGSGVSASTPFRFFDGDIPRGKVTVNQAVLPVLVPIASGSPAGYQLIGSVYVTSGNALRVLVTDEVAGGDIGKYIYTASIAVVPKDPTVNLIRDSQSPLYCIRTGTWGGPGADDYNHSQYFSSTPGSTAAFVFSGLIPGSTYTPEIQWGPFSSRSTAVPWTLSDGVSTLASGTLDQTQAPTGGQTLTDLFSNSWTFQPLTTVAPTTPTLTLTLTVPATGTTIASAALVKLVTAAGYSEAVSSTVANLTTGPPTIKVNGGSAVTLTDVIYGIDAPAPWMAFIIPGSPLLSTDVVTLTTSNNSMFTVAGTIAGVTDAAVANKVGSTVGLGVPGTKTMGVGWNLLALGNYVPIFANMVKNNSGLVQTTVTQRLNADGYPGFVTSSTYGYMEFGQFITNPIDSRGYPLWPVTGTQTIMWDGACGWYPTLSPQQPGTNVAFVSLDTGHATNNRLDVNFTVDGSDTTYAPVFSIYFAGLSDIADDADTGRFATTGTWTTQTGGWNGHFHRNNKVITDKATWTLGALPAGTWTLFPFWVANAGNTTAAVFKVKEAGSQIATYTANQTAAPSGGDVKGDYNHNIFTFDAGVPFTSAGGIITVELTGGTDGWAVADSVMVNFTGTLGTPFVPMTNLRVFDGTSGINPASPPEFHPVALATLAGAKSLRSMQLQGAIYGCMTDYADYTPESFITYGSVPRVRQYTITKIESYSDPNGIFAAMAGDFNSALFTVTPINGAPLPLVNGTAPNFPANISVKYTDWTSGNGHVLDLSTQNTMPIEYDPAHMATNQFAAGYHAFGPSTLITLNPTAPSTATFYLNSIPWPAYFRLCATVGAKPHVNLTRTVTQACVNQIVTDFKTVFPTAQDHYVEDSNEPWNFLFPDYWYFVAVAHANSLSNQMQGYAKVASQRYAWWTTALGSRSSEVSRVYNVQLDGPATATNVFTYCNATGQPVDIVMVSAYTGTGLASQTGLSSLYEIFTAAMTCDFVDGQLNLANRYQPVFLGWQTAAANQTATSGHTCRWGIYEGGQASSNMGGASLTQELQSFAGRYHPLEYPVTLSYLAMAQSYGCEVLNHYALDQPPNAFQSATVSVMFGVYYAHGAIAGKGDGSDGLHDNRTDIAGAPPGVVDFLAEVTPIGAAYNTWNSASGSVLTSGTASVVAVGGTSVSLAVDVATGGSSPYTYQWRRSTTSGSGYADVSGATSTTLTDTGLTSGTTYYYVCVVTDAVSATATSNQVSATPLTLTSGTASTGSVGTTYASVAVDAATGGTAPYTYQWRRSTTSGSGYANVSGATSTILVDTGLTSGTTYYYICVVTDAASATATSNEVSATPTESSTNPVLNFLILKLFGGAMPAQLGLPVALGRSLRVGVHNDSTFAIPPNVITCKLAGLDNLLAFLAPVALIAPSDGSGVSAGIGPGQWAFGVLSDNSTFNAIGGDVSLMADLSATSGNGSGTLLFQLQNSADGGTTWPDPGTGITLGSLSVRQGQKTGTTVKV